MPHSGVRKKSKIELINLGKFVMILFLNFSECYWDNLTQVDYYFATKIIFVFDFTH